jgi:hypothetical protein
VLDPTNAAINAGHPPPRTGHSPVPAGGYPSPSGGYPVPPPMAQGPRPQRDDTNGLAIAALIISLVGIACGGALLGIIFGIIALVQIRRSGQRGRGMAITGIVLGALQAVAIIALVIVGLTAGLPGDDLRNETGEITGSGDVPLADLVPGDCVNGMEGEDELISDLPAGPCAEPHQAEVIATFDLPKGDWPGQDTVDDQAWEGCLDRFEEYSFAAYDDPSVGMLFLPPTRITWRLGDREVICFAHHREGERTGSIRD